MKKFIKENPTLAFGLGLPVALVLLLSLASGLPSMMSTPPRYDVVFATNAYDSSNNGYSVAVTGGKLHLTFRGSCGYYNVPQFYRYRAATNSVSRIDITVPPLAQPCAGTQPQNLPAGPAPAIAVNVPDLASLNLDNANPAPDGYEFTFDNEYRNSGLVPELLFFRSSYSNSMPVLKKGNYRHRIPMQDGYYNSSNVRFLGWVVSQ